jgi:alpha-tubulin suppressor-like RCC1 family protein
MRYVALLLTPLLLLSCKSGTEPIVATALAIVSPPPTLARSGVALDATPVVELRDGSGAAFSSAGVAIVASVEGGSATLNGTTTRTTDASGRATFADLAISGAVGSYTLKFSSTGLSPASSTPITLGAGPATAMTVSPSALQGTVGEALTTLPSVTVKDASGNPIAGVTVDFNASQGTLSGARQTTNASGVATLGGWTLPTAAGQYTLAIDATAAAAVPRIVMVATANPGAPQTMTAMGGDGQSALYLTMLGEPLQVRLTDKYGNPTPGVVVTWGSVSGAGTVAPLNVATDADGIVRSNYRLGNTPGQHVIRASVNPLGLTRDFTATAKGFSDQVSVSVQHSCALDEDGAAYCWGQNFKGQLGDGSTTQRNSATAVAGGLRFSRISAHNGTTCGLTSAGVAYCWGSNGWAGIGDGTTTDRSAPTEVAGMLFREISTGGHMTCGIAAGSDAAYCWGANLRGELGSGALPLETCTTSLNATSFACSTRPIGVDGGHAWSAISAGDHHVCGITITGELYCWGESLFWGGSADGTPQASASPVLVAAGMAFSEVSAGGTYTCGIAQASGAAYCWGLGGSGEVGTGSMAADQRTPAQVMPLALHVDAGQMGTCAVLQDGRAQCWGVNDTGAVGDGTTTNRSTPTTVVTALVFTSISAGGDHSCARANTGQLTCWGNSSEGQLGSGSGSGRAFVPQLVVP